MVSLVLLLGMPLIVRVHVGFYGFVVCFCCHCCWLCLLLVGLQGIHVPGVVGTLRVVCVWRPKPLRLVKPSQFHGVGLLIFI